MKQRYCRLLSTWLLLAALLAGSSCRLLQPRAPTDGTADAGNFCGLPRLYEVDTLRASVAVPTPTDTAELPRLSRRSRQLARAFGLGPGLRRLDVLAHAANGGAEPAQNAYRVQRQALTTRVLLASGEVLRVAEELDCEEQRADQAGSTLQHRETRQVRNLTIGSLVVGAGGGLANTLMESSGLEKTLSVGGAVISAGLGLATLFVNAHLPFAHPRNLLADVWYQRPRSALYPAGLWAVLNAPPADGPGPTPLQTIRQRWAQYDELTGRQAPQQQALYFGAGGRYGTDELHTRSGMLTQVEDAVRLVNQDLQKLLLELSNAELR